eukprot:6209653-Pleurochrysis_carterae.AAC.1
MSTDARVAASEGCASAELPSNPGVPSAESSFRRRRCNDQCTARETDKSVPATCAALHAVLTNRLFCSGLQRPCPASGVTRPMQHQLKARQRRSR